MTTNTVAERVAAGAAWLDEHQPGWDERIDLDSLQMDNCQRCMLGQLYGDYWDGPFAGSGYGDAHLDWDAADTYDRAVTPLGFQEDDDRTCSYGELAEAWTALIKQRRAVTP